MTPRAGKVAEHTVLCDRAHTLGVERLTEQHAALVAALETALEAIETFVEYSDEMKKIGRGCGAWVKYGTGAMPIEDVAKATRAALLAAEGTPDTSGPAEGDGK